MASQRMIVLNMLRAAGQRGVHSFEMREQYIANPSQRILELEQLGFEIKHGRRERLNGTAYGRRYYLISEPGQAKPPAVDDTGAAILFEPPAGPPRGPYDDLGDAA